jgi:hypothetical protein
MFLVAPLGVVLQFGDKPVVVISVKVTATVPAVFNAGVEVVTVNVPEPVLVYVKTSCSSYTISNCETNTSCYIRSSDLE